jgi:hypothetical protein
VRGSLTISVASADNSARPCAYSPCVGSLPSFDPMHTVRGLITMDHTHGVSGPAVDSITLTPGVVPPTRRVR